MKLCIHEWDMTTYYICIFYDNLYKAQIWIEISVKRYMYRKEDMQFNVKNFKLKLANKE